MDFSEVRRGSHTMRRTTLGMLALVSATAAGCGGGSHFANRPRPPVPVNMTVYVNDQKVSVSPGSVATLHTNTFASWMVTFGSPTSAARLFTTSPLLTPL